MIKKIIPTLVSLSLLAGCSSNTENTVSVEPKVTQVNKAHLYYNGNIIPMNTTEPSTVEALVERAVAGIIVTEITPKAEKDEVDDLIEDLL